MQRAVSFWKGLGFEVLNVIDEPNPYISNLIGMSLKWVSTTKLRLPGDQMILELLDFGDDAIPNPLSPVSRGITHIAFTVESIEAKSTEILALGGQLMSSSILKSPDGRVRVAYFSVFEEFIIELVEPQVP